MGRGQCRSEWAAGSLRTEAGERAKGIGVRVWGHPGAMSGPERLRQAGGGCWSERREPGKERGRGSEKEGERALSRESCWEQIRQPAAGGIKAEGQGRGEAWDTGRRGREERAEGKTSGPRR